MTNILVVDDHWMVRRGIRELLEKMPRVKSITEASNLKETFEALQSADKNPDLVVLDASLGDESGIGAIAQMKAFNPAVKILVLSFLAEEPHGVRAIEQGADGYIVKGGTPSDFEEAVQTVLSGTRYMSRELAHLVAERLLHSTELTPREWEIVRYYVLGKGCVQIANLLSLSPKTVSAHKSNAMKKLGLNNTADLIRWGLDQNVA